MKYKIGDKVRIKTWEQMEKEFGLSKYSEGRIDNPDKNCRFIYFMEKELNEKFHDRVITIKEIKNDLALVCKYYRIKEIDYYWTDNMIECLVSDYKEPVPIYSRWEILDL